MGEKKTKPSSWGKIDLTLPNSKRIFGWLWFQMPRLPVVWDCSETSFFFFFTFYFILEYSQLTMFVIGSSGTQPYIYVYPFSPEWLLRRHGEESTCQWRRCKKLVFDPWVRKRPSSRKWQPTPVSLPVPFHGQRSLAGYSPWRFQKPDRTQRWTRLLLQTPLPAGLPSNTEQSSLHYRVGACCLRFKI